MPRGRSKTPTRGQTPTKRRSKSPTPKQVLPSRARSKTPEGGGGDAGRTPSEALFDPVFRAAPLFFTLFFVVICLLALVGPDGALQGEKGQEQLMQIDTTFRARWNEAPLSERGTAWHLSDAFYALVFRFGMFASPLGHNETLLYSTLAKINGVTSPFADGIAYHDHQTISAILSGDQPGPLTVDVVPDCRIPSSLLRKSGPLSDLIGKARLASADINYVLLDAIHTFDEDDEIYTPRENELVQRQLVRNMWNRVFREGPSISTENNLFAYIGASDACVTADSFQTLSSVGIAAIAGGLLGAFAGRDLFKTGMSMTFNAIAGGIAGASVDTIMDHPLSTLQWRKARLSSIRAQAYINAKATAVGTSFYNEAVKIDEKGADGALRQLVDSFLFEDILGPSYLIEDVWDLIHENPIHMESLWNRSKDSFLLETARLYPPIVAVSGSAGENGTVHGVSSGGFGTGQKSLTLEASTSVHLTINTANRDSQVFGGKGKSKKRADVFDPDRDPEEFAQVLRWNGVHSDVISGRASRGYTNYEMTMDVVKKIVDRGIVMRNAVTQDLDEDASESYFNDHADTGARSLGYFVFLLMLVATDTYITFNMTGDLENSVLAHFHHYLLNNICVVFGMLYRLYFNDGASERAFSLLWSIGHVLVRVSILYAAMSCWNVCLVLWGNRRVTPIGSGIRQVHDHIVAPLANSISWITQWLDDFFGDLYITPVWNRITAFFGGVVGFVVAGLVGNFVTVMTNSVTRHENWSLFAGVLMGVLAGHLAGQVGVIAATDEGENLKVSARIEKVLKQQRECSLQFIMSVMALELLMLCCGGVVEDDQSLCDWICFVVYMPFASFMMYSLFASGKDEHEGTPDRFLWHPYFAFACGVLHLIAFAPDEHHYLVFGRSFYHIDYSIWIFVISTIYFFISAAEKVCGKEWNELQKQELERAQQNITLKKKKHQHGYGWILNVVVVVTMGSFLFYAVSSVLPMFNDEFCTAEFERRERPDLCEYGKQEFAKVDTFQKVFYGLTKTINSPREGTNGNGRKLKPPRAGTHVQRSTAFMSGQDDTATELDNKIKLFPNKIWPPTGVQLFLLCPPPPPLLFAFLSFVTPFSLSFSTLPTPTHICFKV
jgi:hypothetical protein